MKGGYGPIASGGGQQPGPPGPYGTATGGKGQYKGAQQMNMGPPGGSTKIC